MSRLRWALAALLTVLSAVTVTVAVTLSDEGGTSVTITVGGPHGTPERELEVPKEAIAEAKVSEVADHEGLRGEIPPGVPPAQLEAAREQQEQLAAADQLPIVTPLAAPQQRGCVTKLVQNYSSRRGVRPRLFVVHYTVSPNRPGWSDVNAIVGLFDRPSFQASSSYVIDAEGNCAYIVRESDKPWTQAAANPVSVSVEMINSGREGRLAGPAGMAKLGRVASDSLKRWEIPLQLGRVAGCRVVKPGIVTHQMLGPCGGGHVDISPYSVQQVLEAAKRARFPFGVPSKPKSKPRRERCDLRIRSVQSALNRAGARPRLVVDGLAGPRTRQAIARFQRKHRLDADGIARRSTARALGLCSRK